MTDTSHDIEIILNGKAYTLRPTFEALTTIERQLSHGVHALAHKLVGGLLTLEELKTIIVSCCVSAHNEAEMEYALVRGDFSHAVEKVAEMFGHIFGSKITPAMTREQLEALKQRFPDATVSGCYPTTS